MCYNNWLEKNLSPEQLENINLSPVADVIKDTKVGKGINFLPRTIVDLTKTLPLLLSELTETGMSDVKKEVAAILKELHLNDIRE